jgi:hypothetical protein
MYAHAQIKLKSLLIHLLLAIMSLSVCYAFLLLVLSSWYSADATKGLDVSTLVDPKDFDCLKDAGYEFLIVRGYRSLGSPDPDAIHTIANARQAGFKYIDVYMFPCPKCAKSASAQVDEMGKFYYSLYLVSIYVYKLFLPLSSQSLEHFLWTNMVGY